MHHSRSLRQITHFSLIAWAAFFLLSHELVRAAESSEAADWVQWRGTHRDGQVSGPAWPDNLSTESLSQAWRVECPPGYSGPLVSEQRVFTVGTEGEQDEVVQAFDRESGRLLWSTRWPGAVEVPMIGRGQGNWIKSTPVFDGETLFVLGMEDVFVALDGATGEVRWRVDFKEHFGGAQPEYGSPSSPLVFEDWVYVQGGARLVRMRRDTGEVDWEGFHTGDAKELASFSSPVIATLAGREQLISFFPKALTSIDPQSGETLWEIPIETALGAAYPTPLISNDDIFLSLYGRKTHMFRVSQNDDGTLRCEPVWENKAKGYMSSPVAVNGHAYVQLTNRRIVSINLESGEEDWGTSKRYGLYWGMSVNGDKILALDGDGLLYLIQANTEKLEILDSRKVADVQAWAPIAFSGNELYVRDIAGLTKFVWSELSP